MIPRIGAKVKPLQVGPYLALLEVTQEDAIRPTRKEAAPGSSCASIAAVSYPKVFATRLPTLSSAGLG
jgi:hypothetical protein